MSLPDTDAWLWPCLRARHPAPRSQNLAKNINTAFFFEKKKEKHERKNKENTKKSREQKAANKKLRTAESFSLSFPS